MEKIIIKDLKKCFTGNEDEQLELESMKTLYTAFGALENYILYSRIYKDIFFVYFPYQGHLLEFNQSKPQVLERMRKIYKERNLKKFITFNKVIARLDMTQEKERLKKQIQPIKKTIIKNSDKDLLEEKSNGDFKILSKDSRISEQFQDIQKIIKNKRKKNDTI